MSLINDASLILTPNSVKEGKLYSIIPSNGNGDMTVVRATATATRTNELGLIESVAANVPRLNYDGSCPSILVEPQRTNLVLRSEEFENASWVKQGVSVIANSTISPDGTIDADTVTSTTTGQARVEQTLAVPSVNTTYTYSTYAKSASSQFVALTRFSGNSFAIFNLSSGTIINQTAGVNATIISVGNGWYRISIIVNALTTDTASVWKIHPCTSTDPFSSVVGNSIFLWGAQIEAGSYSTSYIPTTNQAITRNADVITRNNIYTNNLITSAGGTWFVELNNNLSLTRDTAGNGIWIGDNNTTSTTGNSLNIRHNGLTTRLVINKCINGILTQVAATPTNTVKIAIDWNGTTADVFVNGVKVVTGTAFTTTNMEFLKADGSDVPKYIKSMMLFPTPLTDSECIALTTL